MMREMSTTEVLRRCPAGIHPAAIEHVAALAIALRVSSVNFSTNKRDWSAVGKTFYLLPEGIPDTDENIRTYGIPHRRENALTLPHLRSDIAYATALHELGHCAVGENEVAAWIWAYENALYWTPLMWRFAFMAIGTYALKHPAAYPQDKCIAVFQQFTPFNVAERMSR